MRFLKTGILCRRQLPGTHFWRNDTRRVCTSSVHTSKSTNWTKLFIGVIMNFKICDITDRARCATTLLDYCSISARLSAAVMGFLWHVISEAIFTMLINKCDKILPSTWFCHLQSVRWWCWNQWPTACLAMMAVAAVIFISRFVFMLKVRNLD